MSLITEDGSGLANAESYITVADATTRHSNLGNAAWAAAASDTVREQALRNATNYMLQAYRARWKGLRRHFVQSLDWPRIGVTVDAYVAVHVDIVPAEVAAACADLALRALSADLNADLTRAVVSEQVGTIQVEYDKASPEAKRYRPIDMMLAPYLTGGPSNASLVRG